MIEAHLRNIQLTAQPHLPLNTKSRSQPIQIEEIFENPSKSSIGHLPKLQETPKYSPQCFVSRPSYLYQRLLYLSPKKTPASSRPTSTFTLLCITKIIPSEQHPSENLLKSEDRQVLVQKKIPTESENCGLYRPRPTKSSDIDIVSLPLVTHQV